jgi:hypothetical protein
VTDEERAQQTAADLAMLDRIRTGADFTQPPRGTVATAAQVWGSLLTDNPTDRLRRLEKLLDAAGYAFRCTVEDHVRRIEDLEREVAVLRVNEAAAWGMK